MAADGATSGGYSNRAGYDIALYIQRQWVENANNRSTYNWQFYQRNYASNTPSWFLDAKTWYVNISGQVWSGAVNCDFRGIGYGGQRTVATGSTGWFGHDANGYLNVSYAASHDTGSAGWGIAQCSSVLYTDRIPKRPAPPGGATFSLITPTTARSYTPGSPDGNGAAVDSYLLRVSVNSNPETSPFTDYTPNPNTGIADLINLTPGVTYYARTYAHNSEGWTAGPTTSFKTLSGAYVGMNDIFQGTEILVGSGGSFVTAEMYVGKDGAFVLAT